MTELWVALDERPGATVISARGKIMFDTQPAFDDALKVALATSPPRIVVDLHEVTICDSTGLRLLIDAHRQSVAAGGWLRLCRPGPLVRRVLEVTNLTAVLPVHSDVDAAVSNSDSPGSGSVSIPEA